MSNTLKARYEKLANDREPFLRRAREVSKVTIPALYPPQGFSDGTQLEQPYQSLGARGVNHLASKLAITMFPVGVAPFILGVPADVLQELAQVDAGLSELEQALAKFERLITNDFDVSDDRVVSIELFKHLLVAGNVVTHEPKKGTLVLYPLDRFVAQRDHAGNLLELYLMDKISPRTLSESIRQACDVKVENNTDGSQKESDVELYTSVSRLDKKWTVSQEINGKTVPGMGGDYSLDDVPFAAHRLIPVSGQDYGRGYVEEYAYGDLRSYEALSQALVEGAANAAKVVWLRDPNGTTSAKVIEAPNGAVRSGRPVDMQPLRLDKNADFTVAFNAAKDIAERLQYVFLLHSAIQRKGERVTAEEIRYMAGELDDGLGGIYTASSAEVLRPILKMKMARMRARGEIPKVSGNLLSITLTTGVDAIGRGHKMSQLRAFMADLKELGPEAIAANLEVPEYINRAAAYHNIDPVGLVKSAADIKAKEEQAQMAALAARVGPEVIKQVGNAAAQPEQALPTEPQQ